MFTRQFQDTLYHKEVLDLAEQLLNNIEQFFTPTMANWFMKCEWMRDAEGWLTNEKNEYRDMGIIKLLVEFSKRYLDREQYTLWKHYSILPLPEDLLNFYKKTLVNTYEINGEVFKV